MASISVSLFTPVRQGAQWLENIGSDLTGYQHVLAAFGGYVTANFAVTVNRDAISSWWQSGLGRHVETYDADGGQIWEGFVNRIRIKIGTVELTQGPLTEITNRVVGVYAPLINDAGVIKATNTKAYTPLIPAPGASSTIELRALRSQGLYGIWQRMISIGQAFSQDAERILVSFLGENCMPPVNRSNIELGGQGDNQVQVECLGYVAYLDAYPYNYAGGLAVTAEAKIRRIVSADPNRVLSRDYSLVAANGTLTSENQKADMRASAVIKDIVNLGGPGNARWVFGVGNGRKVFYRAASRRVDYLQSVYDPAQITTTVEGGEVRPWQVQPGKWLLMPDLIPLETHDESRPHEDVSAGFIEQATYTAPNGLALTGSKFSSLGQKLSRLGLGGLTS